MYVSRIIEFLVSFNVESDYDIVAHVRGKSLENKSGTLITL